MDLETGSQSGVVRETDYTYFSNGNLETETSWYSEGADPVKSYTYDTYGNLETSEDPNGNTTTMFYDDTTHTYPKKIVYPTTGSGTVAHEVEMTYDNVL